MLKCEIHTHKEFEMIVFRSIRYIRSMIFALTAVLVIGVLIIDVNRNGAEHLLATIASIMQTQNVTEVYVQRIVIAFSNKTFTAQKTAPVNNDQSVV